MACNTLENTKRRFKELGLIDNPTHQVSPENYNEVERLIKIYQQKAEEVYGVTDTLFELKSKTTPDATGKSDLTIFNLDYKLDAFEKLDIAVAEFNDNLAFEEDLARFVAESTSRNEQGNQYYDEEGNVYGTADDVVDALNEEEEMFNSMIGNTNTNQVIVQPNFEDYIIHKKELVKKLEKSIAKLYNEKRVNSDTHVTSKINRLNRIKENFEKEIAEFTTHDDKVELIKSYFEKDFELIQSLLSNPTLDNVFLAKDLFKYIKVSGDIRVSNIENKLFKPFEGENRETDVKEILAYLHSKINDQDAALEKAVDDIFLKLLEKNQEKLSSLFPGKTLPEIKDELLKKLNKLSAVEAVFFSQGEQIAEGNNILEKLIRLEYEKEQLRESAKSQKLIEKINAQIAGVEKELAALGKHIHSSLGGVVYSGYDYKFFYQVDEKGIPKSSLVGKYSLKWENFDRRNTAEHKKKLFDARQNKDWAEVEKLLVKRFNTLDENSEFVNFTLLHDIYAEGNHTEFKQGTDIEAEQYKQSLIAKIGNEEYQSILEQQRNLLDDYKQEIEIVTEAKLLSESVYNIDQLSNAAKENLTFSIKRLNPLEFLNSYNAGTKGMIEGKLGTQSFEKPSYIKYNTYVPRTETTAGFNTGYYDNNFTTIENNPVLYEFWKTLRESTQLINENLIDSSLKLNKNSLLLFKKQFAEDTVNKKNKEVIKHGLSNMFNVKQAFKNLFSAKIVENKDGKEVVLPTEIKTIDKAVENEFSLLKTELSNLFNITLVGNPSFSWRAMNPIQQGKLMEMSGMSNGVEFLSTLKTQDIFTLKDMRMFSEKKIMEQQTFNLPLMTKAFLELSAEHKARTKVLNEINVYSEKSASILNTDGTKRTREEWRRDLFNKQVVLNQTGLQHWEWSNVTQFLMKKVEDNDYKFLGKLFIKNFTAEEKEIYNSAITRLAAIDSDLASDLVAPELKGVLAKEKAELESRLRMLGKDYVFSALYNNVVNELSVRIGLGFNVVANIKNKLQGMTALITRDGEFWTKGNIYPVQRFTGLNKLQYVNPAYKKEWEKSLLFIRRLNLIQDGTNELQRAESKIKHKTRWLHPMYGTEVVEYYNQVPGILAMAMDIEVTDKHGNVYPLFDGSSFTIYDNNNGVLKLKDEFRTPENIQHYEDMDSEQMITWKSNVNDMIKSLHGDYSKTGVNLIKSKIWSKTFMMFKTWLPRYISSRLRYKQKNIVTGEEETGYLLSSLMNKKTSVTGALMLGLTGALGIMSTSPLIIALPIVAGIAGIGLAHHYGKKEKNQGLRVDPTDAISIGEQALFALKSSTYGLLEMPVNVLSGRELIKSIEFSPKHNLTPQEQRDIRLMARNMQNTIWLIVAKLLIQYMFSYNDEDEPKGEAGSEQRKKYEAQQKHKKEVEGRNNFIENTVTGLLQETGLILEPQTMFQTMGSNNGLQGPLDKIIKMSSNLVQGEDEIQKGKRAGQSKFWNSTRKFLLPSLFRDLGNDTWRGGFETSMESEWIKNEAMDGIFDSDYKKDVKKIEKVRKKAKLHIIEEFTKENNIDMKKQSPEFIEQLEKEAKSAALEQNPTPARELYDEDQEKITKE